ncbi:sucrose-6-phosphate hydrolase [Priestia megaterium]|uniref:Sucrose-6-phosphate hydrolase n=1 Tax=Priestia megaterium TaxID=1404 RepID=A0AAE5UAB1_PRIMG|nr:glycoside hydrolase family 32 protein [Priestia megaterium]PES33343.1 sucrose-6-phosphate hydrolase [Priestia megaterium]PFJ39252.1 sucrose-6-phosphate hydrolase [Priestia megaterium]PGN59918.1 sucrose-6-phosphate hydrolase [Priestia megaterium]
MFAINKLQQAQETLDTAKEGINNRYRLGYHIMAPANWINDPNGLVQYKGEYHVFYQHHPYDENWGPMHWGHIKSKDLVHWEHLPIALAPGDVYDADGCFSGSAVDNNGELTLIYTGHNYTDKEKDIFYQNQNIAVSTNGVTFHKIAENPVIAEPPTDSTHHFRDPKVWKHEDNWYMVVGNSTKENIGRVILYRSPDLRKWSYVGVLAQGNEKLGFMWECPDFFELDGKHVLMISPQGIKKDGDLYNNLFQTGYLIGDYNYETNEFIHGSFNELDNGHDFYAVQTLLDEKGRRIAIGWMDMWESDMPTKEDGWCGALTLPREVTLGENDKVLMNPVEELNLLREIEHNTLTNVTSNNYLIETNEDLLEIKAVFDLTNCNAQSVGIRIRGINQEETVLTYHLDKQILKLDCSKSGKVEDGVRNTILKANQELSLRIFLDRSSIEVFANEGQATMTSRIYPTEDRLGIEVFADIEDVRIKELTYWKLKDIWK